MKSSSLLLSSAALLLASCGGSSLGMDAGNSNAGNGLTLTSANTANAAALTFKTALGSAGLADVGGVIGVAANTPGNFAKAVSNRQTSGFLVNVLQKVPFGPDVYPCDMSGMLTISGTVTDPFTLTAGDVFNVDASACDDGLGEVVDGLLSMTITDFSGDLFQQMYLLGMDATLNGLQVASATETVSSSGDTAVLLDTMAPPFVTASVSGTSMMTSSGSRSDTLRNYRTDQTVNGNQQNFPYTLTSSGTVESTLLSGTVRYTTPVQFTGFDVDYPDTGEILIMGNNSSARLVALDNVNVRIDIDSDGNGSVDETILTTWADLLS